MEPITTLMVIFFAIIQIIMIIVFFVMAKNVSTIRKCLILKDEYFQANFYALLLAGEKEKAKLLLFEQISKKESFVHAVIFQNTKRMDSIQQEINKEYKDELRLLGMDGIDMSMLKISKE